MKHTLTISVSKKPRADSIVNFRSISIRERFLRLLFGIPCKMTILVPGDSVEKLSICEVNKEGRREQGGEKMSRTKLLLDVVSDMRSLADSLETMANAVAGNDGVSKEKQADKPSVTHEMLRELAVKLSRNGKREEIKQLIEKYGVKNITAVAESDLDSFYADLQQMEVS